MLTLRNNKINNDKSSKPKSKSQEDFEKELEDFVKELEELKKFVESMWRIGRWWDCGPFKPFTWLNVEEFKDVADNYIQLVKNNNFEGNREQISELIDNTLAKMETHPSSKMRSLFGYCIGKSHGFQGTSYNNINRQKDNIILKKDVAISKLEKEYQDLKDNLNETVNKQVKEEIQKSDKKHAYEMQKLRGENQGLKSEIEKMKKENQASNIEIEKMKQENQERDKQIETLMKLCNTLSLGQMATQNAPSTSMHNVELSQSLPSLEK